MRYLARNSEAPAGNTVDFYHLTPLLSRGADALGRVGRHFRREVSN